jgi:hypothetical protein
MASRSQEKALMADGRDNPEQILDLPAPQLETVADRLQRLEKQLASLQDPAIIEQQVTNRVMTRLQQEAPKTAYPEGLSSGLGASIPAARLMLAAAGVTGEGKGFWSHFAFLSELQTMLRMYFDPRYRVSRVAQFAVPGIVICMVLNYFFFNQLMLTFWIITPTLERIVLIGLAVGLYKVLSREVVRYREVLAYLTRFGQ